MSIKLFAKDGGTELGTLTEPQLASLVELLEAEDLDDRDYFVNREIVDYLEAEGGDGELVALLRRVVGDGEGLEVEWRDVS